MTTVKADSEDQPVSTMLGANPLVGVQPRFLAAATGRFVEHAARDPRRVARTGARLVRRLGHVARGEVEVPPEPGDRRFADPVWQDHPLYRRLGQTYLTVREELYQLVEEVELEPRSAQRAEFAVGIAIESLSPTNTLLNPAALRRARETRGRSLVEGAHHLLDDLRHNGGMPSMVDREPFSVGENVAITPGRVVFKNEVLELIQYEASTNEVGSRPIMFVPPQINKFYILDIGPGKSMVEYLVGQGFQVFVVSWRNPTSKHREWNLDTYVDALVDALEVVVEVTGSDDVNLTGACAGGMTTAALLGHLAAIGSSRVHSATFLVTLLDMQGDSAASAFVSEQSIAAAIRRSRRKGILDGRQLARVFAWLRPNDLVWNYWVNNYLLGNRPPAFDILAWNADTTNLPASLHADFLAMATENPFVHPGTLSVRGTQIDIADVDVDAYVVAGLTDHITPWATCYRTVHLLGGRTQFVLSSSGHIQALVNPPGNPKARYLTNPEVPDAAEDWLRGAETQQGSWWEHWTQWLAERSGDLVPAPTEPGSRKHLPGDLAPGRYVHNL